MVDTSGFRQEPGSRNRPQITQINTDGIPDVSRKGAAKAQWLEMLEIPDDLLSNSL
jgi:hypothetical protein